MQRLSRTYEPLIERLWPSEPGYDAGEPLDLRPLTAIAVHSGIGAGDHGTARGPAALNEAGFHDWLTELGLAPRHCAIQDARRNGGCRPALTDSARRLGVVADVAAEVAETVEQAISSGHRILVVGGDHSIASGTWAGAANAMHLKGRLGLIWIDAHMDAHVPETTPSGNWHGMPVAHLLGHGEAALTRLARHGPALHPRHLCLLGARSYEPEEAALLDANGVHVMTMDDICVKGFQSSFAAAVAAARHETACFGLTLDLDVIDPTEAPGVGSPVPGGLAANEIIAALRGIAAVPGFVGLEIAEFNPERDSGGRTLRLIHRLIGAAFEKDEPQ